MKKRMYLFIALFAGVSGLYAQDCAKGYCPSTILVHHKIGDLSPSTTDITYNVMKSSAGAASCWITQNLGCPIVPTDYTDASNGWLYQPNRKKGWTYNNVGGVSMVGQAPTSGTTWPASEDPCTLTFGAAWRLPTQSEYINVASGVSWALAGKLSSQTEYYGNGLGGLIPPNTPGSNAYYTCGDAWAGGTNTVKMAFVGYGGAGNVIAGNGPFTIWSMALLPARCMKLLAD